MMSSEPVSHQAGLDTLAATSASCHPACVACKDIEAGGLGLRFVAEDAGFVVAEFACDAAYQGYPDRLHGGIVATLLDAAMTHCLFARGVRGFTARLQIRYHRPVLLHQRAEVRAWVCDGRAPIYFLESEVRQQRELCASAKASFYGVGDGSTAQGGTPI